MANKIKLLRLTDFKCYLCGVEINETTVILEHIIPRSKGGSNRVINIAPSCNKCNRKKGSLMLCELKEKIIKNNPINIHGAIFYYEWANIEIIGECNN